MSLANHCYDFEEAIIPLIFATPTAICSVVCLIYFLCNYNYKSQKSLANNLSSTSSTIKGLGAPMILYCLFVCQQLVIITIDLMTGCTERALIVSAVLCYFGAFLFVLCLFTIRIIKTFENTQFAVSKRFIMGCKILVLIVLLVLCITTILNITDILPDELANRPIIGALLTLTLLIYGLVLLQLFATKLNHVINNFIKQFGKVSPRDLAQLNRSISVSFDHDPSNVLGGGLSARDTAEAIDKADTTGLASDNDNNGINNGGVTVTTPKNVQNMRNLTRLIADMSKYTIIVGIAILSSLLATILGVIIVETAFHDSDTLAATYAFIPLGVDCLVNCACLHSWLQPLRLRS